MSEPLKTLQISQIEVLAFDLDSPQKLSFDPDGHFIKEIGSKILSF